MGAKAPIFSEFGAKARNRFRPAPTKEENQRLSTIFKTTIGAKASNCTQLDAGAHLPPKMKKQPNYKTIKTNHFVLIAVWLRFGLILASIWDHFWYMWPPGWGLGGSLPKCS